MLLATNTIAAIIPRGEGTLLSLNVTVEGFGADGQTALLDIPFKTFEDMLKAEFTELKKGGPGSSGFVETIYG